MEATDTAVPTMFGASNLTSLFGFRAAQLADVARAHVVGERLHQQVVRVRPPHAQGRDGRDEPSCKWKRWTESKLFSAMYSNPTL